MYTVGVVIVYQVVINLHLSVIPYFIEYNEVAVRQFKFEKREKILYGFAQNTIIKN